MLVLASLPIFALAGSAAASWTPPRRNFNDTPLYKDPTASVDERVADLLPRMSLAEKISQITQGDIRQFLNVTNTDLELNRTGLILEASRRGGQLWTGLPNEMNREKLVWAITEAQKYMMENTTLGIPALMQTEGLHGFIDNGTIFPSPIAMGCSFNPELMERSAATFASEAIALGIPHLFAPVLDLALEQRFGRVEETFSEDWRLVSLMGKAFVDGIQNGRRLGTHESVKKQAAATCKHFAAFATPENGLNLAPVHGGERQLRSVYLRAFHHACMDALTIMSSYNSFDGYAVSASYHILQEILREEWGWKNFVTTDAGAVDNLMTLHGVASSREECAKLTVENGLSGEMGGGTYTFFTLEDQVNKGTVNETYIDRTVATLLRVKFELGLFENPYPYANWTLYDRTAETAAIEKQMDDESIVILENNGVLPVNKGATVALIGPQAGQTTLGDYVFPPAASFSKSPLDGFNSIANDTGITLKYAEGCKRWSNDESGFDEAIAAATGADVAVVMVGTWTRDQNELWAGLNATTGEHVDVHDLGLVGAQLNLVKAIKKTGTKLVVVFVSGRPVAEPWIAENADAIIQQFYPGEAGGISIAEAIMGLYNPSGKMSISAPRHVGTLPVNYNYLKGARYNDPGQEYDNGTLVFGHQYVLSSPVPLWSFGHGLSYTNFSYNSISLNGAANVSQTAEVDITVQITNTGDRDGMEVVQLYFRDVWSSVVTPVRQLIAFSKVLVKAGETKDVKLTVPVVEMGLWSERKKWVVEPGEFVLFAGGASDNTPLNASLWVQ